MTAISRPAVKAGCIFATFASVIDLSKAGGANSCAYRLRGVRRRFLLVCRPAADVPVDFQRLPPSSTNIYYKLDVGVRRAAAHTSRDHSKADAAQRGRRFPVVAHGLEMLTGAARTAYASDTVVQPRHPYESTASVYGNWAARIPTSWQRASPERPKWPVRCYASGASLDSAGGRACRAGTRGARVYSAGRSPPVKKQSSRIVSKGDRKRKASLGAAFAVGGVLGFLWG
ncbi:hypothetical protein MRX96_035506 [Rhipicephalus microplus]